MSNYQFTSDLINTALFHAGEATDGTSPFASSALTYVNRAYQAIALGGREIDPEIDEKWLWLKKISPVTLSKAITSGSVTVTENSINITFSSAPASSVVGYHFRVDNEEDVYKIATHTGGSASATLDSVYTGTTGAGKGYKLLPLEYTLNTDIMYIAEPMIIYRQSVFNFDYRVYGMELNSMERDYPLALVEFGVPNRFAFITDNKVRFNRVSDTSLIRVEYTYLRFPPALTNAVNEEPLVPVQYRSLLCDVATYYLFMDKNDNRADAFMLAAKQGIKSMAKENRQRSIDTDQQMMILPRTSRYPRFPLRTESGHIVG